MIKKLRKSIHSLKIKILLILILIIVIPFLLVSFTVYKKLESFSINKESQLLHNNLKITSNHIDDILNSAKHSFYAALSDEEFINKFPKIVNIDEVTSYSDISTINYLHRYIYNYSQNQKYVESVYLYNINNNAFYTSSDINFNIFRYDIQNTDWFQNYNHGRNVNKWTISTPVNNNDDSYIVSYYSKLRLFQNNSTGIISVNILENIIYDLLKNIDMSDNTNIHIISNEGKIISSTNREIINKHQKNTYLSKLNFKKATKNNFHFVNVLNGENKLITYYSSPYTGWTYFSETPYNTIVQGAYTSRIYILYLYLFIIFLLSIIIFIIGKLLYAPINQLFNHMKKIEQGDFTLQLPINKHEEINYIYDKFNEMTKNINTLINDNYIQQIQKQETEIKYVQTQINEHFLYNTLDSVYWLAQQEDSTDASNMILSLSRFFRISLSNGKDIITVDEVVSMLDNYVNILLYRHKEKYKIIFDIDENVKHLYVLKHIFQPIVENAIIHGVDRRKSGGLVYIQFMKITNSIRFCVKDNGPGMDQKDLDNINYYFKNGFPDNNKNFALKNIYTQVKLFYKENFYFNIESKEDEETIVTIEIPFINNEN